MKIKSLFFFMAALACLVSCKDRPVSIFNGENLDGWYWQTVADSLYSGDDTFTVKDGALHISGRPYGYIRTKEKYSNYVLTMQWRRLGEKPGDGGIYNFIQDSEKMWPVGVQCQMTYDDLGMFMSGLPLEGVEPNDRGSYRLPRPGGNPEKPMGEWNDMVFDCGPDGRITITLNGVGINSAKCSESEGYIGFQSEGSVMEFRNLAVTLR